jgi:subtilisin family serine protease
MTSYSILYAILTMTPSRLPGQIQEQPRIAANGGTVGKVRGVRATLAVLVGVATFGGVAATAVADDSQPAPTATPPPLEIQAAQEPVPSQYVVTLRIPASAAPVAAHLLTHQYGGTVIATYSHALSGYAARMSDAQARALSHHPWVASVEQDGFVHASATESPVPSWGLDRIDQRDLPLDNSYTSANDGAGVTAYIIDTGIRVTNVDFGSRASVGYDSVGDAQNGNDCNGHGTHVAGTVGGTTYGVAKAVSLVAVRVLGCNGSGTYSGVIAGVDWVTGHHGLNAVANMSLGGGISSALDAAVENSVASGVTYAVAAGNSSANACNYSPARAPDAITVGATTSTDVRASYSNYGTCLDIFAPGSGITSDWNTSDTATNTISGTSMATPHITGSAALYLADHSGSSPATVTAGLLADATTGHVGSSGAGSPNLLDYVGTGAPPSPPPAPVAPGAPVLSATATRRAINLSWTTPADGGSAITGYRLYRGTSPTGPFTPVSLGVVNSYRDMSVTGGVRYYYYVTAVNGVGEGAPSNTVNITTKG